MLSVKQLSFSIAGEALINQASLVLQPGELVAVIGPNGAGKTTLLKILSSDLTPSGGSVTLDDKPLADWSRLELARRRAVMPQSSSIVFPFSAYDVVMMGRSPHLVGGESECDERIVMQAMATTRVAELAARNYNTLSGGEQQRVQLARALAQIWSVDDTASLHDRYLLLDEPIASMDPASQLETLRIARTTSRRGASVLVIIHDINLAAMYADRIAIMSQGELTLCGQPRDVLSRATIADVFGIEVSLQDHPSIDCPLIVPLGGASDAHAEQPASLSA